ncbi:uncharacterized protein STEHIDRAFT_63802 [Stereum hirsutum FP-91666 SS1]|uniref:uncharacterized protein n=1 Tax=Stereum hirsutum (strain FP-91666) TaxID=721885 RepID=UPI000444A060|nr:uncharacterized protein STEHIDRAFT_63802 [Stereum hirsutum FP-91666 SS1]EIM82722.1 hypothetical protein STEHIDRAFT_63802 [Stereum hirsutum FP-91666 SS1]
MGILTEDDGLIDAALSEILSLPLDKRHERDPERDVDYLLTQHSLAQGEKGKALSHAQKSLFAEPSRSSARRTLAVLALQNEDPEAALAALSAASAGIDEGSAEGSAEGLALQAVARALKGHGNVSEEREEEQKIIEAKKLAQQSVMLAPWEVKNWETLAFVRTRTEGIVVC